MRHYIIGCGGVGSWLVPRLSRLTRVQPAEIHVFDGDTLEERNLERQFFSSLDLGSNKAEAMAYKYDGITPHARYFHEGLDIPVDREDMLWCCADNSAARRATLAMADSARCRTVIGANEYTDAEAYWYEWTWRDTGNDPRRYYPVILTDTTGDPLAPEGCTGEAADAAPQLVLANDMAGALMLSLYWFHDKTRPTLPEETRAYWPVHHKSNVFKLQTIRYGDR